MYNLFYPVGCIYTTTVSTNPGTLFGVGTWEAFGEGRVLVGKAGSGTFNTAGATGGVETVTLTAAQSGLPAHTHGDGFNTSAGKVSAGGAVGTRGSTAANTAANAAEAHTNLQPYIVVYMWKRTA
jgi:microcystin-dependent protein